MASPSKTAIAPQWTRRQALKAGAAAVASAPLGRVRPANAAIQGEQLRIASVGVGNKGWDDLQQIASARGARIVALCDVDSNFLDRAAAEFDKAAAYRDYRQMLDERGKEIDAVVISTPDHMHGAISLAAMDLGKHVYVQKPLAHNLAELRQMMNVAVEKKVITQMGTQVHGDESYRTATMLLRNGAIGKVTEIHSWIGRSLPLPATKRPELGDAAPPTLDWNLWQGVAKEYPYAKKLYHPFNWRMWRDYGGGILGDMGCHLFDPLFGGLDLKPPVTVQSAGPVNLPDTFALDTDVTFTFAATPYTAGEATLRWTNGAIKPDAARAQLPAGVALPDGGSFVVGEKGVMLLPHWAMPMLYSKGAAMDLSFDAEISVNHYHEWVAACRGEGQTSTPFTYGGPITEAVLLGTIAGSFPQQQLRWDSAGLKFDDDAATALVHRQYREGWRPAGV